MVDAFDCPAVLDGELLDAVDDASPVRIQQAFRQTGTCKTLNVQCLQSDGLVLARHLGSQLERHVPALVSYPTVCLSSQDSCLLTVVRAFLLPRKLLVEVAEPTRMLPEGTRMRYLLA